MIIYLLQLLETLCALHAPLIIFLEFCAFVSRMFTHCLGAILLSRKFLKIFHKANK